MDRNEADRWLEEAARGSPDLARLRAGERADRARRARRVGAITAVAVVAAGTLWLALPAPPGPGKPAPPAPAEEIDRSVYLPPIETQRSAGGEETSPFAGFAVAIDTEPPGALVAVGASVRGEAPVLANVACRGSEKIEVRAEKAGFRPVRRAIACRADTLVKLTLRLEK